MRGVSSGRGVLDNAKRLGEEELAALDRTLQQAMDAATKSASASRAFSGGGPGVGTTVREGRGSGAEATSSLTAPVEGQQQSALVLPTYQESSPPAGQMMGTPWTVNNAALPAYPAQFTPQLPYTLAPLPGAADAGSGGDTSRSSSSSSSAERDWHAVLQQAARAGRSHVAPIRQEDGGSGADDPAPDVDLLPPGEAVVLEGPAQEGPLALYPDFALVDQRHKWLRIHTWAQHDSSTAVQPPAQHGPPPSILSSQAATRSALHVHEAASLQPAYMSAGSPATSAHDIEEVTTQQPMQKQLQRGAHQTTQPAAMARPVPNRVGHNHVPSQLPRPSTSPAKLQQHAELSRGVRSDVQTVSDQKQPGTQHQQHSAGRVTSSTQPAPAKSAQSDVTQPSKQKASEGVVGALQRAANKPFAALAAEGAAATERAHAAEAALHAAEKRHTQDMEKLRVQVAALEAALASERALSAKLQGQLASEIEHAAEAARHQADSESTASKALESARKALEAEKRRTSELTKAAAEQAAGQQKQQAQLAALERQLQEEKEVRNKLSRQLAAANKGATQSRAELAACQAARSEQERRLEAASGQVAAMRAELAALQSRLTARDQQLMAHVQEVETAHLNTLREEVATCQSQLSACASSHAAALHALLTIAHVTAPGPLNAILSSSASGLRPRSSLPAGAHAALVERVAAVANNPRAGAVSPEDTSAIAAGVRGLLDLLQEMALHVERSEAAITSEANSQMAELQAQVEQAMQAARVTQQEYEARIQSLTAAVHSANSHADDVNAAASAERAAAAAATASLQQRITQLQAAWQQERTQLTDQASTLEARLAEAGRELQQCRGERDSLEEQYRATELQVQQYKEQASAKDGRLGELRSALASAQERVTSMEAQLASSTQQLAARESDVQQLQAQLSRTEQQCQDLQHELEVRVAKEGQALMAAASVGEERVALSQKVQAWQSAASAAVTQLETAALLPATQDTTSDSSAGSVQPQILGRLVAAVTAAHNAQQSALQSVLSQLQVLQHHVHHASHSTSAALSVHSRYGETADDGASEASSSHVPRSHSQVRQARDESSTTATIALLQEHVQQVAEAASKLAADCVTVKQGAAASQAREQALQTQVRELQGQLEAAQLVAKQDLQTLKTELTRGVQVVLQEREHQLQERQKQLQEAASKQAALAAEAQAVREEAAGLQAKLNACTQDIAALEQRCSSTTQEAGTLFSQVQVLQECKAQLEVVQQQRASDLVTLRKVERRAQVDRLRAKLGRQQCIARKVQLCAAHATTRRLRAQHSQLQQLVQGGRTKLAQATAAARAAEQAAADAQARATRAETLVNKLEERRASLESDRRSLTDQVTTLRSQLAGAERQVASLQHSDTALRRELAAANRAAVQLSAAESRAATLLEALEGAEAALRTSQSQSTKLLQAAREARDAQARTEQELVEQRSMCAAFSEQLGSAAPSLGGDARSVCSPSVSVTRTHAGGCKSSAKRSLLPAVEGSALHQQQSQMATSNAASAVGLQLMGGMSLSGLAAPAGSVEAALAAKDVRIEHLRTALASAIDERKVLKQQVEQLTQQLQQAAPQQAAQADAQMLVLDLSQAVMSAQQHATEQLSSVGAETEGLSRAHGAAMQEFRQLAMHLQEELQALVLSRDAAVARLEEALSVSQDQCRDLSLKNTQLQQDLEAAQSSSAGHAAAAMALTAETSELKASLESYRATCQALEDSNAALQQRCSQVEAQLVQQALLNVERTSLQDPASPQPQDDSSSVPGVRPAESSVSLAEHEAAVGRVQALEAERSTLESKLDEVTATLAAEQAQSQGLAAQVAELSSRVEALTCEMEEVRSRSDEAQQRLLEQQATLKADLLEAQLERDDAAKLLQASQASCSALSAQTADLEAQLMQAYEKSVDVEAKAAAQAASLQLAEQRLRTQQESSQQESATHAATITALKAEALTSKATINELQSKVKQLQQQLTAQQLLHEQCSADLAAAQEELSRSREDACSLTAELQALSGQMDECVPLEEHTRALGQLRAQMRSLQEQLASAEKENAASRDVLTSQQLQQSEVETRLSQANLKLDEADQRTGQLQRALHAAEAEVARARAEAAHWQRKAEHVEQELEHVQALQELWQQQVTGCKEAADQAQHVDASSRQRLVTRIQELEDQLMASSLAVASQQQQLDQHADAEWQLAAECAQLRAEVDRLSQQLHSERAHSIAAVKDVQAVSKQDGKQLARSEPAVNDNADLSKLAQLLQEHRQLAERLQATQAKLKVMRARLAQAEGQLAAKHAREGVAASPGALPTPSLPGTPTSDRGNHPPPSLPITEVEALRVALAASQEEIAVMTAHAAMLQSRMEQSSKNSTDTQNLGDQSPCLDQEPRSSKARNSMQLLPQGRNTAQQAGYEQVQQQVALQEALIASLKDSLAASQASHSADCDKLADTVQQLATLERRVRALQARAEAAEQELQHVTSQRSKAIAGSGPPAVELSDSTSFQQQLLGSPLLLDNPAHPATAAHVETAEAALSFWRAACSTWQQHAHELEVDLAGAHEEVARSQAACGASEQHATEAEVTWQQAVADLQQTCGRLEQELAAAQDKASADEAQVTSLTRQLDEATNSLTATRAAARRQLAEVQLRLDEATSECTRLTSAIATMESRAAEQADIIAATQAELQHLALENQKVAQHAEVDSDLCHALHDALQVLRPLVGGQPQQSDTTDFMHTTDLHTLAQELRSHVNALPVAVQQLKAELQSSQAALAAAQSDLTNTTRHSSEVTSQLHAELGTARKELARLSSRLSRREADLAAVEKEISRQVADYERLKARLVQQEQESSRVAASQNMLARKCDELHMALAAKQSDCAAATMQSTKLQEDLNATKGLLAGAQERLRMLEARRDTQAHEAQSSQVLQAQLEDATNTITSLQQQLAKRTSEIRDLQQMLKAWDAMRLGKDAQIAALIERCKRYEEEKQEQSRTVESLRRKIACIAPRPGASGVMPDTSDVVSTHSSTGSRRSHMQLHLHMHPASHRQPAASVTSSPNIQYLPPP